MPPPCVSIYGERDLSVMDFEEINMTGRIFPSAPNCHDHIGMTKVRVICTYSLCAYLTSSYEKPASIGFVFSEQLLECSKEEAVKSVLLQYGHCCLKNATLTKSAPWKRTPSLTYGNHSPPCKYSNDYCRVRSDFRLCWNWAKKASTAQNYCKKEPPIFVRACASTSWQTFKLH